MGTLCTPRTKQLATINSFLVQYHKLQQPNTLIDTNEEGGTTRIPNVERPMVQGGSPHRCV